MAHIPDGFLSVPVIAGTAVASAAALAVAARRSRRTLGEREGPVLGATTAFVFAAQMLNFPVGIGASAHLLGGTLVAILLGPWAGTLVLFAVLLVQALLFQDGGIVALGANTLNVAVLGVGSAALVYRWATIVLGGGTRGTIAAAAIAAWASTALVGLAVAVELALSGLVPAGPAMLLIGGGHVAVGIAEAVLTAALVGLLLRTRPGLVPAGPVRPATRSRVVGLTVAAAVVMTAAVTVASTKPDVLESALEVLGLEAPAPLGRRIPVAGAPWVAGAVGLLAAFLVTWGLALAVIRRRP